MIRKSVFKDEIIRNMKANLAGVTSKSAKVNTVITNLVKAAEIFEDIGNVKQACGCVTLIYKLAHKHTNVHLDIPSMEKLFEHGLTVDTWRESMKGSNFAIAKLNMAMRDAGYSENQMRNFLGQRYFDEDKTNYFLSEIEESNKSLKKIKDFISEELDKNPNELKFKSLAKRQSKSKFSHQPLDENDTQDYLSWQNVMDGNDKSTIPMPKDLLHYNKFVDVKDNEDNLLDQDLDVDVEVRLPTSEDDDI